MTNSFQIQNQSSSLLNDSSDSAICEQIPRIMDDFAPGLLPVSSEPEIFANAISHAAIHLTSYLTVIAYKIERIVRDKYEKNKSVAAAQTKTAAAQDLEMDNSTAVQSPDDMLTLEESGITPSMDASMDTNVTNISSGSRHSKVEKKKMKSKKLKGSNSTSLGTRNKEKKQKKLKKHKGALSNAKKVAKAGSGVPHKDKKRKKGKKLKGALSNDTSNDLSSSGGNVTKAHHKKHHNKEDSINATNGRGDKHKEKKRIKVKKLKGALSNDTVVEGNDLRSSGGNVTKTHHKKHHTKEDSNNATNGPVDKRKEKKRKKVKKLNGSLSNDTVVEGNDLSSSRENVTKTHHKKHHSKEDSINATNGLADSSGLEGVKIKKKYKGKNAKITTLSNMASENQVTNGAIIAEEYLASTLGEIGAGHKKVAKKHHHTNVTTLANIETVTGSAAVPESVNNDAVAQTPTKHPAKHHKLRTTTSEVSQAIETSGDNLYNTETPRLIGKGVHIRKHTTAVAEKTLAAILPSSQTPSMIGESSYGQQSTPAIADISLSIESQKIIDKKSKGVHNRKHTTVMAEESSAAILPSIRVSSIIGDGGYAQQSIPAVGIAADILPGSETQPIIGKGPKGVHKGKHTTVRVEEMAAAISPSSKAPSIIVESGYQQQGTPALADTLPNSESQNIIGKGPKGIHNRKHTTVMAEETAAAISPSSQAPSITFESSYQQQGTPALADTLPSSESKNIIGKGPKGIHNRKHTTVMVEEMAAAILPSSQAPSILGQAGYDQQSRPTPAVGVSADILPNSESQNIIGKGPKGINNRKHTTVMAEETAAAILPSSEAPSILGQAGYDQQNRPTPAVGVSADILPNSESQNIVGKWSKDAHKRKHTTVMAEETAAAILPTSQALSIIGEGYQQHSTPAVRFSADILPNSETQIISGKGPKGVHKRKRTTAMPNVNSAGILLSKFSSKNRNHWSVDRMIKRKAFNASDVQADDLINQRLAGQSNSKTQYLLNFPNYNEILKYK